jgi:hypothetical protein
LQLPFNVLSPPLPRYATQSSSNQRSLSAWSIALSPRLTDTIGDLAPVNVRGGGNKSTDFIPGDPNPQKEDPNPQLQ